MSLRPASAPDHGWSPIVELRQYALHPGQRGVLIDLFDTTFVEPQEALGMKVIGQFRDLDDSDRFVWLRGFPEMSERAQALADFYGGPVWQAHRKAANATIVDSDDVLLLRPARPDSAFTLHRRRLPQGFVAATILQLGVPAEETDTLSYFECTIAPAIGALGGSILAYFVTETSANTFPALPVREGEHVFVWFAGFPDRETLERASIDDPDPRRAAAQTPGLKLPSQVLRLAPTSRSLLHGRSPTCRAAVSQKPGAERP
jgi:hypothetical protein